MSIVSEERKDQDDEDLLYTRDIRKRLVSELTTSELGQFKLPDDVAEQSTLLKALADMDKAALSKKRLKVEDKQAEAAGRTASIIADMYKGIARQGEGFRLPVPNPTIKAPSLAHAPALDQVEGETAITPPQGSFESFMANAGGGASPSEAPASEDR